MTKFTAAPLLATNPGDATVNNLPSGQGSTRRIIVFELYIYTQTLLLLVNAHALFFFFFVVSY